MSLPRGLPLLVVLAAVLLLPAASQPTPVLAETSASGDDGDRIDPRRAGQARHPGETSEATVPTAPRLSSLLCSPLFGTFGPGNLPGGCWRPYADSSPFNQTIPANPRLDPDSDRIVARLLGFGSIQHLLAGEADTPDDYGHPTYYSQLTDPLYTLHCYEASWGTCPIEGRLVNVPSAARPAAGPDGHMTVVDQRLGIEYDLYKVRSKPSQGGTLEFRWGGSTPILGSGLASGATASKVGSLAGIIRAQELEAGHIDHAIFMVAKCDSGQYAYPAQKTGRACSDIGLPNTDAPPMGARFQLDMSDAEINALAVPAWKKTIFRAMARYGMIMGDTGSTSFAIQAESGSTYTSFGYEDRFVSFARQVGAPLSNGKYVFNLRDGVDWSSRLRVVHPALESAGPPIPRPPAGRPGPAGSAPRRPATVAIRAIRAIGRNSLLATLRCRPRDAGRCRGRLKAVSAAKKPKKPVTLARKAFSITGARTVKLKLRLSARGRALFRRRTKVRAMATAVVGNKRTTTFVTLRARK